MPRQLPIDYPGAIHHVMSRGDRRANIYHDDMDRQDFLKTPAETFQKTDWQETAINKADRIVADELKTIAVDGTRLDTLPRERSWEIADRGAVEAVDHPVAQEHCDAGWVGEFKECQRQAALLDANKRESGRRRRRNPKTNKIMPRKRTKLMHGPF